MVAKKDDSFTTSARPNSKKAAYPKSIAIQPILAGIIQSFSTLKLTILKYKKGFRLPKRSTFHNSSIKDFSRAHYIPRSQTNHFTNTATKANTHSLVSTLKRLGLKLVVLPHSLWVQGFFKSKKFLFLILPLTLSICILSYIGYSFFFTYSAVFTANIHYKVLNISQTKTVSTATNPEIKLVDLTNEDSITVPVTTTKDKATGNQSTGRVVIINVTSQPVVITKGTKITCLTSSCKSLNYITQQDANVGPYGGRQEIDIVAADIGQNYNFPPDGSTNASQTARFSIPKYNPDTEVFASNITKLAGGTPKKIVKTVSASDITSGEKTALDQLKSKILNNVHSDSNYVDYVIADSSLQIQKTATTQDIPVDTEADLVNVTVQAKGVVKALKQDDINQALQRFKQEMTPEGYYLDTNFTKLSSDIKSTTASDIRIDIKINSIARPQIDTKKLAESLKGKSYKDAVKTVNAVPHISSVTTDYTPKSLPQFLWKVPNSITKIQINLVAETRG